MIFPLCFKGKNHEILDRSENHNARIQVMKEISADLTGMNILIADDTLSCSDTFTFSFFDNSSVSNFACSSANSAILINLSRITGLDVASTDSEDIALQHAAISW